jgi:pyruvate dehydrogenase E2 component (dihydrolipoamide acetyltransferase)
LPTPVTIPKASISFEEGIILKWFAAEGDSVTSDSLLFELDTDKATVEVPSPAEGVLLKILTNTGPVRVEEVVGWIGAPGENIEAKTATVARTTVNIAQIGPSAPTPPSPSRTPSTPAARRRAAELGLEIANIQGTGPGGRITEEDVERSATSPRGQEHARGELTRSLAHAWQTVPHIQISRRLEADGLAEARERVRARDISVTDLLLFALSRVLPSFPELTRSWNGGRLEQASSIDIALAVDTEQGVVAPVIRNVPFLDLEQISARRRELVDAARVRRLKLSDAIGGVFTFTNLGMDMVDFFAPIVNWPQTSILATGRMTQEPVVRGDSIGIGWRMWTNIALDHRAADGAAGARLLAKLQDKLNHISEEL